MSSALLEEKKMQNLKYLNQNWITIPPITVRPPSQSNSRISTPTSKRNSQPIKPQKIRPFANSAITFTNEEMDIIRAHDMSYAYSQPRPEYKLTKNTSQLQKIQDNYNIRASQKDLHKKKKLEQNAATKSKRELEREDSYISVKLDEEDEFTCPESSYSMLQSVTNIVPPEESHDLIIDEIKKNVWIYAHSKSNHKDQFKTREIQAKFIPTDKGLIADIQPTPGIRQLRRTIALTSQQDDTLSGLTLEAVQTPQQRLEEDRIKSNLQDTYSAYRLREYMEQQDLVPPPILDQIDFHKTAALANQKKRSTIRKIPQTPRRGK